MLHLSFIEFGGFYLSSRKFLQGLSEVNTTNRLYSLITSAGGMYGSATSTLVKLKPRANADDLQRVFTEGFIQTEARMNEAFALVPPDNHFHTYLLGVMRSLDGIKTVADEMFDLQRLPENKKTRTKIEEKRLIVSQYQIEFSESYRKALLALQEQGTNSFTTAYENRYLPLVVAILLATICFFVVITVGLSLTRRFTRSLNNLLTATDIVARGNLSYEAGIFEADEIGKLTHSFNLMVKRLSRWQDQMTRLQDITAAFSEALSPQQMGEVIIKQSLRALKAFSGILVLLKEGATELEVIWQEGSISDFHEQMKSIPLDMSGPLQDAIRLKDAIWVERRIDLETLYPELPFKTQIPIASVAALPLIAS